MIQIPDTLSRCCDRRNLIDTVTAASAQLSLAWLAGFVIVVLCISFLRRFNVLGTSSSQRWSSPLPPLAKGIPFIGDTFQYLKLGPYFGIPHHQKHGEIYRSYLLGEQVVHVGDGDSCRKLMTSEHKLVEADWPHTVAVLMGTKTIALITKDQHLDVRKMMLPAFSPKTILQYIPRKAEIAEQMCAGWAREGQLKGEHAMKAFTGKVVCELVLGFPQGFATPHMLARQQALFDVVHEGLLALPINLPGTNFSKAIQARQQVLAMYKENIQRLQQDVDRPAEGRLVSPMELIIKGARDSQDPLYDMQFLQEMCWHLVFAGHDTSASTLSMLLHYLKKEPWVLDKLRAEQQQVQGRHGRQVTPEYLADMSYADVVIKETMRLAAIVNLLPKRALTSFELGGYTIPKGMRVQIELWRVLQNDPRWRAASGAKAPTLFNPDRWLDGDVNGAGSFIPFSAGPRMCPGQGFAWNEMKIMLAVLTRDYDWELDLNEPIKTFPMPVPAWAAPMTFHRLNSA